MNIKGLNKKPCDIFVMILLLLLWKSQLVMRKHMHYSVHEYKSALHRFTCKSDTVSCKKNQSLITLHDFLVLKSALTSHSPVCYTKLWSYSKWLHYLYITVHTAHAGSCQGRTAWCVPRLGPGCCAACIGNTPWRTPVVEKHTQVSPTDLERRVKPTRVRWFGVKLPNLQSGTLYLLQIA